MFAGPLRRWYPYLLDWIYTMSMLNIISDYKLRKPLRYIQLGLFFFDLSTAAYIILLLNIYKTDCQPNRLAHIIPEWLPHLNHRTRTIIYLIFICFIMASLLIKSMVLMLYHQGVKVNYSYTKFFIFTANRTMTEDAKRQYLIQKYLKLGKLPALSERKNDQELLLSTCTYWYDKKFKVLDYIAIFYIFNCLYFTILINVSLFAYYQYLIYLPVKPDSPTAWHVAKDPIKYRVKFEDGLCQIRTNRPSKFLFTLITFIISIDVIVLAFFTSCLFLIGSSATILWIRNAAKFLSQLASIRERQYHQRKEIQAVRSVLYEKFSSIEHHDRGLRITGDPTSALIYHLPLTKDKNYKALANVTHNTDIRRDEYHISNIDFDQSNLELQQVTLQSTDLENIDIKVMSQSSSSLGFRNKKKHVDILELTARNEVMSLFFFIIDSDMYISLMTFVASFGSASSLVIFVTNFSYSNDLYDNLALVLLLFGSYVILTLMVGMSATVNAYILSLNRYILLLVAWAPIKSKNKLFWDTLNTTWYYNGGLNYGYTILGIVNASWSHYFQVLSVILTLLLLSWEH